MEAALFVQLFNLHSVPSRNKWAIQNECYKLVTGVNVSYVYDLAQKSFRKSVITPMNWHAAELYWPCHRISLVPCFVLILNGLLNCLSRIGQWSDTKLVEERENRVGLGNDPGQIRTCVSTGLSLLMYGCFHVRHPWFFLIFFSIFFFQVICGFVWRYYTFNQTLSGHFDTAKHCFVFLLSFFVNTVDVLATNIINVCHVPCFVKKYTRQCRFQ